MNVTIIPSIVPATTCQNVCASNFKRIHITNKTIAYNIKNDHPNVYIIAVIGPAIPEQCTLIFHLRFMSIIVSVLKKYTDESASIFGSFKNKIIAIIYENNPNKKNLVRSSLTGTSNSMCPLM